VAKLKSNEEFITKACEYLLDGNYVVIVCKLMGIVGKLTPPSLHGGVSGPASMPGPTCFSMRG